MLVDKGTTITNQFNQNAVISYMAEASSLFVPTRKFPHKFPSGLSHFSCHDLFRRPIFEGRFKLTDQFRRYKRVKVGDPYQVCFPVGKIHGPKSFPPRNELAFLVCYQVDRKVDRVRAHRVEPVREEEALHREAHRGPLRPIDLRESLTRLIRRIQRRPSIPDTEYHVKHDRVRRVAILGAMTALVGSAIGATGGPIAASTEPAVRDPETVLSHFLCYRGKMGGFRTPGSGADVFLSATLYKQSAEVQQGRRFCNPVVKRKGDRLLAPIVSKRQHLKSYVVDATTLDLPVAVRITNQFVTERVLFIADAPFELMVPTRSFPRKFPNGLDHFACHEAKNQAIGKKLKLIDAFRKYKNMRVGEMRSICFPTLKTHDGKTFAAKNPDAALACYAMPTRKVKYKRIASNQFEKRRSFKAKRTDQLCVPTSVVVN